MSKTNSIGLTMKKASILVDALPYLRDFNQKIIVVSYLCGDLLSPAQEQEIMRDITTLQSVGMKLVIVHGTRMGADKFRENKRIAKLVEFCGVKAIGICGIDEQTLHMTLDNQYIPVVTPNDIDTEYDNLNPVDTAREIAELLHAEKLIFMGGYDGLVDENGDHVYSLTESQLKASIDYQPAEPTMHLMLCNAIMAIDNQVPRVHIINGQINHALLLELFSKVGVGTVIMSDDRIMYPHECNK